MVVESDTQGSGEGPPESPGTPGESEPRQAPAAPPEEQPEEPEAPEGAPDEPQGDEDEEDGESPDTSAYKSLKLSEDSLLDEEGLQSLKDFAADLGLDAKGADKLLEAEEARQAAAVEGWDKSVGEWKVELEHQLGDTWEEADKMATAAVTKFGPEGWLDELRESGFAYHPKFFAFAHAVGKAMSEPRSVARGGPASQAPQTEAEQWRAFYPKSGELPSQRVGTM